MKASKMFCLIFAFTIILCCGTTDICAADRYSWYCGRMKGNLQPALPSEFRCIEDHSVLWLNTTRSDDEEKKVAYLTFDAGYENGNVEKILDILNEKKVKGAFFILINLINSNPKLVQRMKNEGHFVCNHTAYHKDMSKVTNQRDFEKELETLNESYRDLVGEDLKKYYRPPEGRFTPDNLRFAELSGYKTVFWSFAYADWDNNNQPSAAHAKKKILDNIHNGCVILLHPTSAVNVEILGEVIDQMRNEGYEFGTLDDLCTEMGK